MTDLINRASVLEILRTPQSWDTFPDMIRRVEALEGCCVRVNEAEFMDAVWGALKADANDLRKQQRILKAFRAALEPVAQPEMFTSGQFTTRCLAIEDVITGRGFDVAIHEEVKAYLRNALMVGGWRGES